MTVRLIDAGVVLGQRGQGLRLRSAPVVQRKHLERLVTEVAGRTFRAQPAVEMAHRLLPLAAERAHGADVDEPVDPGLPGAS